jgi:acetate kinase
MADDRLLVVNAGSSSIKTALFDGALREILRIEATGIGASGSVKAAGKSRAMPLPDHTTALAAILDRLEEHGTKPADLTAAAHRIVHGGPHLTHAQRITPDVRDAIAACIPLAPLHNPHHIAAIDAITAMTPNLPQCASFDTAFHATNPQVARRYALPPSAPAELRRYGFHGTSYAALVRALPAQSGTLPRRLLALHLGNGASLCAIKDGSSVATTMGYSPLGGLTMGTRAGAIDPGAVLALVRTLGVDQAEHMLTHESGLLGLSGQSADMRDLLDSPTPEATFAIAHFCYWAARQAGSMIAAMGGIDAIAFTGGIGENAALLRDEITAQLSWTGRVPVYTVPATEELHIAREALALLGALPLKAANDP